MKKVRTAIILVIATVLMVAITACNQEPDMTIPPGGSGGSGSGNLTTSQKEIVKEAVSEVLNTIDPNLGSSAGSWETSEFTGGYDLVVNGENWSAHCYGMRKGSAISSARSVSNVARSNSYDIEFTLTSENVVNGVIEVSLDGNTYRPSASEIVDSAVVPSKEWDITVRLAKHKLGETEDRNNWQDVTVVYANGTANVDIKLSDMTAYKSTDPGQQDADHKWFAVLIGTGVDDITAISFDGSPLLPVEEDLRNDMQGTDGSSAETDEFVWWIKADEVVKAGSKTITLTRDGAEPVEITFNFTEVMGDADYEKMVELLKSFGHNRVLRDIQEMIATDDHTGFKPETYGTIKANSIVYDGSSSITFDLTATDYKFCGGTAGKPTVSGDLTLVLSGTGDAESFAAEGYTFTSDNLTFKNSDGETSIGITDVSGYFAAEKISLTNYETGPEMKTLNITITDGEPTNTDFVNGSHAFWIPESGEFEFDGKTATAEDFVNYVKNNIISLF